MKLIHCADLHLDSPLVSNFSGDRPRERARELRETFLRMVRYARGNGVRAILIAGDLFDSAIPSSGTVDFFLETVDAYSEISFFCLFGNHDRGVSLDPSTLPKNLFLFGRGFRTYTLQGGVTVTGSEAPEADTLRLDPAHCNLLLLHGDLRASGTGEDTLRIGDFRGKGIDYLALGHIHSYRTLPLDARGVAVYSGCPEGRGFDECGECGFVLLEIEGRRVSHRFLPFAKRTLYSVELDVGGCDTHAALEARAMEAVDGIEESALVRLVLTGKRKSERLLDLASLEQLLSERFYFGAVKDESGVLIRPEDYENDRSLRGAFVRLVLASNLSPEERERVIVCGLRALAGEELGL